MKTCFILLFLYVSVTHAEVITGWVSEENCKEQHMEPGGKDCVKKCLRGGAHVGHPEWAAQKMLFIEESNKKIWAVQNPDSLTSYAGERIILSAKLNPGTNTLEALTVEPYGQPVPFKMFHFRNGFWINLHHFLRGRARREMHPESKEEVTFVVQLNEQEQKDWQEALDYYKTNFAEKDLLFDEDLWPVKNWLGDAENDPDLENEGREELTAILKKAAPVYRKHWWPEHQKSNQDWIQVAQRLLDQFGSRIGKSISDFYPDWPKEFLVDVTIEAGWAGAYTTENPVRITCSSTDSKMQDYASVESLFHEASHSRDSWLSDRLDAAAAKVHQQLPDKFWHAVLFYTAGEITRKEYASAGINYIPFAKKSAKNQANLAIAQCALEKKWLPRMNDAQWQDLISALQGCESSSP